MADDSRGGPEGPDTTAGTVRLSFQPRAVHVRTARLVAVTVARRAGWPEDLVESVRQGVGEACALALRVAGAGPVTLELDDTGRALTAWVWPVPDPATSDRPGEVTAAVDDSLPRAVLEGLTDTTVVEPRAGHTALRLAWSR